jgi:hypothetical protein
MTWLFLLALMVVYTWIHKTEQKQFIKSTSWKSLMFQSQTERLETQKSYKLFTFDVIVYQISGTVMPQHTAEALRYSPVLLWVHYSPLYRLV